MKKSACQNDITAAVYIRQLMSGWSKENDYKKHNVRLNNEVIKTSFSFNIL